MDLIRLITDKQLEFIRIYHLELKRKGQGVMVFKKTPGNEDAHVAFYPMSEIRSAYVSQRVNAMISEIERASAAGTTIELKNRAVIKLPVFSSDKVELPEGIDAPQVMFFVLMDGSNGRIFLVMPQDGGDGNYYYQMFADPTPEEMKTPTAAAAGAEVSAPKQDDKMVWFNQVCQLAVDNLRLFGSFRSAKEYRAVIGNETEQQGEVFAQICEKSGSLTRDDYRDIKFVDDIGGPIQYYYAEAGWELSPCVLRYMAHYLGLAAFCGGLDTHTVIEVGTGYGGMCVVSKILEPKVPKYVCIETGSAREVAKRYLDCAGFTKDVIVTDEYDGIEGIEGGNVVLVSVNYVGLSGDRINRVADLAKVVKPSECYVCCTDEEGGVLVEMLREHFDEIVFGEDKVVKGRRRN